MYGSTPSFVRGKRYHDHKHESKRISGREEGQMPVKLPRYWATRRIEGGLWAMYREGG
uniref:Expressed protein n=2 Tax=Echinococcus TaxID=6209 RepID=A0A068WL56_ECHGR|nr:expressed protein [Echinococcus granulosus]